MEGSAGSVTEAGRSGAIIERSVPFSSFQSMASVQFEVTACTQMTDRFVARVVFVNPVFRLLHGRNSRGPCRVLLPATGGGDIDVRFVWTT
jgi:hypothetical protein